MKRQINVLPEEEFVDYIGPAGSLSYNRDRKIVHSHDGVTRGGKPIGGLGAAPPEDERFYGLYRGRWVPIDVEKKTFPTGPGPETLIAGDEQAGFFGEVTSNELIDGERLALEIGLSAGVPYHTDEPWLKFAYQGKILYVAKKPFRYGLSFDSISQLGADYGDVTVTVGNYLFKVRLLTGADSDPTSIARSTYDPVGTHNSEWNQLMYRINETEIASDPRPKWATYTDQDLFLGQVYHEGGSGTLNYVSNRHTEWGCVLRGGGEITFFDATHVDNADVHHGWRPVLELIG